MGFFDWLSAGKVQKQSVYNLWIGAEPDVLEPVDDPEGLGAYEAAIERLIASKSPDRIYLRSDTEDLSVVRKALAYLSRIGGEVGVAPQLPDTEVAEIFGVDVATYRAAVADPDGNAASYH